MILICHGDILLLKSCGYHLHSPDYLGNTLRRMDRSIRFRESSCHS